MKSFILLLTALLGTALAAPAALPAPVPYDVSQSAVGKCGNKQGMPYGGDGCCKVPLTYDYNRGRETGTKCDDPWWTPGNVPA
ncbi:hypothetical protein Slin15195_G064030 [Septoria linicola]|uniref:Uncharacterized protein n=1 Tax=Septoria linicola TaxID=215465 RepID=A0A9Q9EKB4_9PEZI|nr:hypothetical protein Slin14017_G114350 [Septoria linicola]USW53084.1 hypothetical protein Slin15195_G064030 [Septoria linicola]